MSQTTDFSREPMKRRSQPRKLSHDSVIDMAEARLQIAQALQLHRSSSSSPPSTAASVARPGGCDGCEFVKPMLAGPQHFCYSILESIPLPQPIWSTTAPSVKGSPAAPMEELEIFEWGDGQASYAWWLGFLKTLDVGNNPAKAIGENGSSMVLNQCEDVLEGGEALFVEAGGEQSSWIDEWLIIPISEDGGFDSNCLGNDLASN